MDYVSGRVVFVGKNRKTKTLKKFFNKLNAKPAGVKRDVT
jgi:hypothetical protein